MARKRSHDLGPAGENGGIERRHLHASILTPNEKAAEAEAPAALNLRRRSSGLALASLEARVGLVDDVDAALAAHDAAVLVASFTDLSEWRIFMVLLNKNPGGAGEIPKERGK